MRRLKEAIEKCQTPDELNSLRALLVKEARKNGEESFDECQRAFIKMSNKFKRIPLIDRPDNWGPIYNPKIDQREEIPDWSDREEFQVSELTQQ